MSKKTEQVLEVSVKVILRSERGVPETGIRTLLNHVIDGQVIAPGAHVTTQVLRYRHKKDQGI